MDSDKTNPLGDFLRARRADLRPEQVGLSGGNRRVPGLRRDEVATLAGLSVGHYTRLEQGKELHPTRQTVASLCRALRLDKAASLELYRLARPVARRTRPHRIERAAPEVLRLLNDWTVAPAYVMGRFQDVLARNPLATALHNRFVLGDNLLRMIFLDPAGREFFRDWRTTARAAVHDLRQAAQETPDEQGVRDLVGELSIASAEFRQLWAGRDPRGRISRGGSYFHPDVGLLQLRPQRFSLTDHPGQHLIAEPAEPGSPSADALTLLSTLVTHN
ncbi:helix-turn-helix domain protein [Kribbella flavida DSM 17836]|uniref:Helix-turn-helix domain protein n=1 Tax=Kribbella flavida (strain DSM 17836 / JCM 10339 / NBRC 14399) TaxID=479435 RepID=D2PLG5_KRIFD|nr:helix-turn-helix transcriptional regulator [Kribbella flavida]ADB30594.1 helix-turn-helix domain protein [Kribbella flavida DSM 17836]